METIRENARRPPVALGQRPLLALAASLIVLLAAPPTNADALGFLKSWQATAPEAVAADDAGSVYTSLFGGNVKRFTSEGEVLGEWPGGDHPVAAVATDFRGYVYAADSNNDRIGKFAPGGALVDEWGESGSGDGQLDNPRGLATDLAGHVYVVDADNDRVQKFDSEGTFLDKWGATGSGPGLFVNPEKIAVDTLGNVYVTDRFAHNVERFDSSGNSLGEFGTEGSDPGQLKGPWGIGADAAGDVFVTETANNRIQKFDSSGAFKEPMGGHGSSPGQYVAPRDVATDCRGNLYVADTGNNRIQRLGELPEGTDCGPFGLVRKWGSPGTDAGQFQGLYWVAIGPDGSVYTLEQEEERVQRFAPDGSFLSAWGSRGDSPGEFDAPYSLAVDAEGNVYVADSGNDRVQKFTAGGQFLSQWGESGSESGEFLWPAGIAIDAAGDVYVTELDNDRVQKFTPDGEPLAQWGSFGSGDGEFMNPYDVDFDAAGNVYVTDADNHRIQVFTPEGDFIEKWGEGGAGNGQFQIALSTTIVGDSAYVVDTSSRVQRMSLDGDFISRFGGKSSADAQFVNPTALASDCRGNIFVTDESTERLQVFGDPRMALPPCNQAIDEVDSPAGDPTPPLPPVPQNGLRPPLGLNLKFNRNQRLKRIFVRVGCRQAKCRVRVTGKILAQRGGRAQRRAARRVALKPIARTLPRKSVKRLRLNFRKQSASIKALTRALRSGTRLRLRVVIAATAPDGRSTRRTVLIRLRP